MRVPGFCSHDPATSVWAHIRSVRYGSGTGMKPPDICCLIVCSKCHDVLDRRVKTDFERDYIMQLTYEGHLESLYILWEEGII